MEITYIPEVCQQDGGKVSGELKIKVPSLLARYDYMEKAGVQITMDGEVKGGNLINAIKYLVGVAKEHITEVKIKSGDKDLKSYDCLMYDPGGQAVLQEIATNLMKGFGPGNG